MQGDAGPSLPQDLRDARAPHANSRVNPYDIPDPWRQHPAFGTGTGGGHFADRDAPGLSHYLGLGDVNGDGKTDAASAAKIPPDGNWFAWWEQPADGSLPWKKHVLATEQEGATNILMAELNGDGKMDFIATRGHGKGVLWFEAPDFTLHEINSSLEGPHDLATGDIDNDGDIDAAACAKDSYIAAWFENDGKGNFTTHHISEDQAAYDIRLVDMEADGDLDVLIAGQNSKNVVWYENRL